MAPLIVEGTWDEVVRRADEFSGKRVRVTVVEEPPPSSLDLALSGLIRAAEDLREEVAPERPDPGPSWGDAVAEKFRRQGFRP